MCDLENLVNEEAMTRVGSRRHSEKKKDVVTNSTSNRSLNFVMLFTTSYCVDVCILQDVL